MYMHFSHHLLNKKFLLFNYWLDETPGVVIIIDTIIAFEYYENQAFD